MNGIWRDTFKRWTTTVGLVTVIGLTVFEALIAGQGPQDEARSESTGCPNVLFCSDILWRHPTAGTWWWNEIRYTHSGTVGNDWQIQGTGDFDGNGVSDILWRSVRGDNAIWTDGRAPGYWIDPVNNDWRVVGIGNFTADRKSDILWRSVLGDNVIWPGGEAPGFWLPQLDRNWQVQGVGDFDYYSDILGNYYSDILWRCKPLAPATACGNAAAGTVAIWTFSNGTYTGTIWPGALDLNWEIQGVGDFAFNHVSDILWRCNPQAPAISCGDAVGGTVAIGTVAIWSFGYGGNLVPTIWMGGLNPTWEIHGVGDFNGDYYSDILWRCVPKNGVTKCGTASEGQIDIWHLANGGHSVRTTRLNHQLNLEWTVQGVGQFDR